MPRHPILTAHPDVRIGLHASILTLCAPGMPPHPGAQLQGRSRIELGHLLDDARLYRSPTWVNAIEDIDELGAHVIYNYPLSASPVDILAM